MSQFVLQPWVAEVGLKMQSILLSGLRAPDQKTDAIKKCVRWMRGNCQIDADPSKQSYMKSIEMTDDLVDAAMNELEYTTVHYAHHFADSIRIVALFHPDIEGRGWAFCIHREVAVELFHFHPESREEFLERHRDKIAEQKAA